jgi:hypothetical protein
LCQKHPKVVHFVQKDPNMLNSKHFPPTEAVQYEIRTVYMVNGHYQYYDHIEHDPVGEEVVALKGYRPATSRRRRNLGNT